MHDLSTRGSDVVILGGGLIGLGIAYELARRGAEVTVLERDEPGRAASWAGAGMLAPLTDLESDDPEFRSLARASLALYPEFIARVEAESGVATRLRLDGTLEVAFDAAAAEHLKDRAAALRSAGYSAAYLTSRELREYEGGVAHAAHGALLCEEEGQIENRLLGRALLEAARRRGVRIRHGVTITSIERDARRVLGVRSRDGRLPATTVINALGAWSGNALDLPPQLTPPVTPIKGQILALAMPREYVTRVIRAAGVYLVPRLDGRLLVGATVEDRGFDQRLTAGGVCALLQGVTRVLPGSAAFALAETWVGFRPGSSDGLPFLGATELAGYFVATGHYRNGILLTPITAVAVAAQIAGEVPVHDLRAFSLGRLARSSQTGRELHRREELAS